MKTQHRQRAFVLQTGQIKWHRSPTEKTEPVDALLNENWRVIGAYYADLLDKSKRAKKAA